MKKRTTILLTLLLGLFSVTVFAERPNIILCMSDDQGWGDVGYNGHPVLRTPHLDRMSKEGIRFDRFYSTTPICSPTRSACLTGRHPYRYGIRFANIGRLGKEEITLPEVLRVQGYRTGHFGKWHLGSLTTKIKDGHRGRPGNEAVYSPPWENGYDECFVAESGVHTYHHEGVYEEFGTHYWAGPNQTVPADEVSGDDSTLMMDRALTFMEKAAEADTPFLAVIWFHAPHQPVVSAPPYTDGYEEHTDYYGCITAMDEQMGRLRTELKRMEIEEDTMLWFCSDNGPTRVKNSWGSAGGLKGGKRSLYEGGVRVPGLLIWPKIIKEPRVVTMPSSTSDYFPTVLDILGIPLPNRPYDGISLLPLIKGEMTERPQPLYFEHCFRQSLAFVDENPENQTAVIDNRYKMLSIDGEKTYQLFDLLDDREERNNIADQHPEIVQRMLKELEAWRQSCRESALGKDYAKSELEKTGVKRVMKSDENRDRLTISATRADNE
jgi:arylsulfatase A-like enzyme